MIQPELIQRTKSNLQWLAEKMPDKFEIMLSYDESDIKFGLIDNTKVYDIVIENEDIDIQEDYKKEFSNTIGRIMFEAFGERPFVCPTFQWTVEKDKLKILSRHLEIRIFEPNYETFSSYKSKYDTELSAQLEALNIRIEQERNKQ